MSCFRLFLFSCLVGVLLGSKMPRDGLLDILSQAERDGFLDSISLLQQLSSDLVEIRFDFSQSEENKVKQKIAKNWSSYRLTIDAVPGSPKMRSAKLRHDGAYSHRKAIPLKQDPARHFLKLKKDGWEFVLADTPLLQIVAHKVISRKNLLSILRELTKPVADYLSGTKISGLYGEKDRVRIQLSFEAKVASQKAMDSLRNALVEPKPVSKADVKRKPVVHCKKYQTNVSEPGFVRKGSQIEIEKQYRDRLLTTDFTNVLSSSKLEPELKSGKLTGFTFSWIAKDSLFCKSGFLPGDTITKIQDKPITTAADAIQLLQTLRNADRVAIESQRDGKTQKTLITIK